MDTQIRILNIGDVAIYKEVRLQAFRESSTSFSESLEDELDKPLDFFCACIGFDDEHFTVGAFEPTSQQLVGIATFKRDKRSKARHKSYIHTMYVIPEFRGKRIAINLLNDLISNARKMPSLEQIHLWVLNPETSPAKRLYLNAGFLSQGTIVRDDLKIDGVYVDAEYMTMSLL